MATTYLRRTPSWKCRTNRKTFTFSAWWLKRSSSLGSYQALF